MLEDLFSPLTSQHPDAVESLLHEYRDATLARLSEQAGQTALQSVREAGEAALHSCATNLLWSTELGRVNELLNRRPASGLSALAQFVLACAGKGFACDVELATNCGDVLYFDGYRLVAESRLRIQSDRQSLILTTDSATFECISEDNGWALQSGADDCRRRDRAHDFLIVAGYQVDPELVVSDDRPLAYGMFDDAFAQVVASADLIGSISQSYAQWCSRVMRQVNLLESIKPTTLVSRSSPVRPGSIVLSHPASLLQHAESLVHECTHQYFYMLSLLTSIKRNKNDGTLFYSALVSRARPIDRILLAYHATANILFFLEAVIARGDSYSPIASSRLRKLAPVCRQLFDTLSDNEQALSDAANAFWQCSAERIRGYFDDLCVARAVNT